MTRPLRRAEIAPCVGEIALKDEYHSRRLKVLGKTSASQIQDAERCMRRWFFRYVEGVTTLPTDAQRRGTEIDNNYVQPYLKTGIVPKGDWYKLAFEAIHHLPSPGPRDDLLIQHSIEMPTFDGGPLVIGYPDWVDVAEFKHAKVIEIGDLKSTSDFRYCKTEDELRTNVQMVTYAEWGYSVFGADQVSIAHVYVRTRGSVRAQKVGPFEMSREEVRENWEPRLVLLRQMGDAARGAVRGEDLVPNTEACMDYGGCPFRARCGLQVVIKTKKRNQGVKMSTNKGPNGLFARLKAAGEKTNGKTSDEGTTVDGDGSDHALATKSKVSNLFGKKKTEPTASTSENARFNTQCACGEVLTKANTSRLPSGEVKHVGCSLKKVDAKNGAGSAVVPPDAPSREQTKTKIKVEGENGEMREEVLEEAREDNQRRKVEVTETKARKKTTDAEKKAEVAEASRSLKQELEKHPAPGARPVPAVAPILFIDALAVKGVEGAVALEDWLGPIAEIAAAAHDVEDVRLISYTSKGVLATAMRAALATTPKVLLIDSRQFGADVAMEVLVPHAQMVVRGTR